LYSYKNKNKGCKATSFYSYICFAFLTFVVRILTFVVRILTFVVIILTFFVRTKAQAKAKANAIVKIRTKIARLKAKVAARVFILIE
jgi:hypothetical protein